MSGPIVRSGPSTQFSDNWGQVFAKKKAAKTPAKAQAKAKKKPVKKAAGKK